LRIPTETLLEGQHVLRYDPTTRVLREVEVQTGLSNWRWTEVLAGLDEDARIVASLEQEGLKDNVAVIPVDAAETEQ
jgi:HlyD family secretion protein